jgi:hypothetical protein
MKKIFLNLIILATLISCNSSDASDILNAKVSEVQNTSTNLNELISTIEFEVKAKDEQLRDFPDGVIPWISIENPENEIEYLIDADEIVIENAEITLNIDYPLNNPAKFILKSAVNGFTKKQLIIEISKKYHEVYVEEEKTAKTKTIPIDKREGVINRNETDGIYGIWGHDIGDLVLSEIEVFITEQGKIEIFLIIES